MITKNTLSRKLFIFFNTIIMCAMIVVSLYPMLYVLFASISDPIQLISHHGALVKPLGLNFESYKRAFQYPMLLRSYLNTIFIVVVGVGVNILMTTLGAYFLTRKNLKLQTPVALMIIFTMYFGGGLIPTYLTIKGLGLYNTIWALIIPGAISTYNMLVVRSGFMAIPDSLEEAAIIDGAGDLTILFRILFPLAAPTIAVVVLYYGVGHWNSWFSASIYLKDTNLYPLQLVMRQILVVNQSAEIMGGVDAASELAISETIKYAMIIISTLPILCVYPFLQKYFTKGVMIGAVKG